MKRLYSDIHRLHCVALEDRPHGIDLADLFKSTSAGMPFGAVTPELEEKLGAHPIEPIERVCEALINHANTLSELKADDEVGAPSRHQNAVPASTINFLAWEMLVRCNNSGVLPPVALLELVRLQLGVRSRQKSDEEEELADKMCEASRFAFNNPSVSFHEIAKRFDVNVSTVSRWNEKYNLREFGETIQDIRNQIDRQIEAFHDKIRKN